MGQRGPKRKPDSRRGRAEAKDESIKAAIPTLRAQVRSPDDNAPVCPTWLSATGAEIWSDLVRLLIAASVDVKGIDAYAVAMAAYCVAAVAEWAARENDGEITLAARLGISKLVQKYQADAQSWFQKIGATASARAAMGIKAGNRATQSSPIMDLLARRATGAPCGASPVSSAPPVRR